MFCHNLIKVTIAGGGGGLQNNNRRIMCASSVAFTQDLIKSFISI